MTAAYSPSTNLKASCKRSSPTADSDRKQRKSRRKFDLSYEFLSQYFHMSQKEAAKCIKVSVITVKRNCKRYGFKWPYRANKYKAGNKPVLSARAQAFRQLPIDCMQAVEAVDSPPSEGDTDTDSESVEDDEQLKKDYGAIMLTFRKAPVDV
ncbi:Winged helix-turn-helix DNA-binding domain [Phytophthora cinnamomi]|uniref:Winged helix-turn-helix DNA-binding domain n=1 Tax=Phytophthora cinnamomi TaxID=4785 RepID=UPI002A2C3978|nr:Winged helix-turn-helix DNA-binding domain [Phytophthora cinnamomi]KAJ8531817.1 hypothetical protein ON010_g14145 [Phytophthora cinnamomi]